jgi:hypothetical protein
MLSNFLRYAVLHDKCYTHLLENISPYLVLHQVNFMFLIHLLIYLVLCVIILSCTYLFI